MLEKTVIGIADVLAGLTDAGELLDLAESEQDEDTAVAVIADLDKYQAHVEKLEFQRMFSGQMDGANAFVDIQAGAGGTEAQDCRKSCCACICAGPSRAAGRPS